MTFLAKYASRPNEQLFSALKRVLRYLKGTPDLGIGWTSDIKKMKSFKKNELWGYADASYADDEKSRRSTMGYIIYLNGGPVSWKTKLTPLVCISTADAELVSACFCACEIMFLRNFLDALGFTQDTPTCLYEDNEACIAIATKPANRPRTKHINVRFMYLLERIQKGDIMMAHCPGERMTADGFTKPLGFIKYELHGREYMCTPNGYF